MATNEELIKQIRNNPTNKNELLNAANLEEFEILNENDKEMTIKYKLKGKKDE